MVVKQNKAPTTKDVYILNPGTCDYVMKHVKRELRLYMEISPQYLRV